MTKPTSINRHRVGSFLFLFVLISTSAGQAGSQAQEDSRRKIVSDDFIRSRKENPARAGNKTKPRRNYRLASAGRARSIGKFRHLGITVWKLRPPRNIDGARRALISEKNTTWAAERVESESTFREGDYVRLSVESPAVGYLYVIDRDLLADGTMGAPMLIFPWAAADNKLGPGRLIDIPGQDDNPNHFTAKLTSPGQVGELLTFIVTAAPLNLPLSSQPLRLTGKQLVDWEKSWGGATEIYEMEGGAGEVWTVEEQKAAAKQGTRQLTRDDPTPQTIYRVFTANFKGMLVNLRLQYAK